MNKNPNYPAGSPAPAPSSPFWNDWAAQNPIQQAKGLAKLNAVPSLLDVITAINRGARPIEL